MTLKSLDTGRGVVQTKPEGYVGKVCMYRPLFGTDVKQSVIDKASGLFSALTGKEAVFLTMKNGDEIILDQTCSLLPAQGAMES